MSDLLPQLMAQRGYARLISHDQFDDAWQQVSGPLSDQTRVGQLRRGVLEVFAKNSVVLQELTFQKRKLHQAITQRLPDQKIRDLKFVVASW
jgi:predicted nucleic acid-binding Zn ribbon protein